jgi:hypothetical protein
MIADALALRPVDHRAAVNQPLVNAAGSDKLSMWRLRPENW